MKITITASRKDDILKRKAEYEAKKAEYDKRHDEARSRLYRDEATALRPVKQFLESQLKQFDALEFEVDVRRGYNWGRGDIEYDFAEVYIRCNEHSKFEDSSALSWSFDVGLDSNGEVTRKSSSWSGLKATTIDQMKSLRQTVEALDFLNEVNWDRLIRIDLPKYGDYYDFEDRAPKGEDWATQLKEAELEELIGTDNIVEIYNWDNSPVSGRVAYIQILKETPSQYFVKVFDSWTIDNYILSGNDVQVGVQQLQRRIDDTWNNVRVRKGNIRLIEPTVTYSLNELLSRAEEV